MTTDEGGFTLIEATVAMLVCTVGLVAMAELLAVSLRMQQLGRNTTSAIRLAQGKVDEFTSMNFITDAAVECGGSLTDDDDANHTDTPVDSEGNPTGYKRRWLVEAGPDGDANLRQITVRVIPIVSDGRVASVYNLTTVIRGNDGAAVCP